MNLTRGRELSHYARVTRHDGSFIRAFRQGGSPRRTVQYPPFDGRSSYFGSLIASGSDPIDTADLELSALRPNCQREHGQRSQLASLERNPTDTLVPSWPV